MNRRLGWEIERFILGLIIIMGLMDFAGLLPPFFAYVMDVIGWTTIAYIIYVVSPTEILFGERRSGIDVSIVLAYVIMSVKDLVGNAAATLPDLIRTSPAYIKFSITQAAEGVPFLISQEELNAFSLFHAVPSRVVEATAPHLNMAQQQLSVLLLHGNSTISLTAMPTGHNGMMLMYYNSILQYAPVIQKVSLILGVGILLAVSIYAAYRIPIRKRSVLGVLKEEGNPTPVRVFWVFIILMGFFVMVFNLLFEWMTITNDAPLIAVAVVVLGAMFFFSNIHLGFDEMIETLGNIGDDLYGKVLHLFMDSKTILLGISGFLVLHLLTDVGNYVAPSIFGWYETIYVRTTGGSHEPLYSLISASMTADMVQNALTVAAYVLSTVGIILLLSLPAVIWYKIFRIRSTGSHEHLPDWKGWQVGLILGCITVFLIAPVFSFSALREAEIIGVNLTTQPLDVSRAGVALAAAGAVFLACALIGAAHDYARRVLMLGPLIGAAVFFGIYVFHYFTSSFIYYATQLVELGKAGEFWILPVLFVMFSLTIVFFITGFLSFLYEIWRD